MPSISGQPVLPKRTNVAFLAGNKLAVLLFRDAKGDASLSSPSRSTLNPQGQSLPSRPGAPSLPDMPGRPSRPCGPAGPAGP